MDRNGIHQIRVTVSNEYPLTRCEASETKGKENERERMSERLGSEFDEQQNRRWDGKKEVRSVKGL